LEIQRWSLSASLRSQSLEPTAGHPPRLWFNPCSVQSSSLLLLQC
jgi:hypothetical protein